MTRMTQYLANFIKSFVFSAFILMVVVTFMQVVSRYVFGHSFFWAEELARYAMVWLTFLGAALAILEREHINIDFFIKQLPKALYPYANVLINLILVIFVAALMYYSLPIIQTSMKIHSTGLGIPMGYVNLALPVSGVFMIVYLITDSVRWVRKGAET